MFPACFQRRAQWTARDFLSRGPYLGKRGRWRLMGTSLQGTCFPSLLLLPQERRWGP